MFLLLQTSYKLIMEDIREVRDILQFILRADDIEHDASLGSDMVIPVYDISAEEFLAFAENAIASGTKEGLVNAISNLKRALDCEIDMFFECLNLKRIFDRKNLKFEKKTQFLADIGLFPTQSINKLNLMRNKLEHEYKIPDISDLHAYYELVWSIVKIIDLYLELLYINGEINLILYIEGNDYYFTMEDDIKESRFKFEVMDRTWGKDNLRKQLEVNLEDQNSVCDFVKAFSVYLLSMEYFNYGNLNLYKKKVKRLLNAA